MQEHLDFKLYLDAATQSVTRTRNSIYLLLTIFVAVLAVYINTNLLDWSQARLQKMKMAYQCISNPNLPDKSLCEDALRYADELHIPRDQSLQGQELYKEYRNALIRRRTDLRTIQLPLFGAVLDLNDLGVLNAILFGILLIIVRTNLHHEFDSLDSARRKAEEFRKEGATSLYKESKEMLSRVQVLASPRKDNRGFRWSAMVVISMPMVLHAFILWHDHQTLGRAYLLMGSGTTNALWITEGLGLVGLFLLWVSNAKIWLSLAYLFHDKEPPRWARRFMTLSMTGWIWPH